MVIVNDVAVVVVWSSLLLLGGALGGVIIIVIELASPDHRHSPQGHSLGVDDDDGRTWALSCGWKGEPGGIKIQTCSAMYLMSLPLLGPPLVISDPSVANYDLLRLAHITGRCMESCDMARFRGAITKLSNSKSIRISNISVEKILTNDLTGFRGLGDQWEV